MGTAGNNSWEGNRRLHSGAATTSTGGGGTPLYPNAWCRLQRAGQNFTIYRSDDGMAWTQLGTVDWAATATGGGMPDKLFVGLDYSPENGNITDTALQGMWLTKFRDYGDTFRPAQAARTYSIGLKFGADQPNSTLRAVDIAGVPEVSQPNWNSISAANGTAKDLVADAGDAPQNTGVTVTFVSNGTWASTGVGEENNVLTGSDRTLMTGYLDTGDATTTSVTVSGVPDKLTSGGYDVYVYTLGGVAAGRSGGYRILDAATKAVLKDYVFGTSPSNVGNYVATPVSTDPKKPGVGNYIVFRGLKAASIILEATTAGGKGGGAPPRAPINAIQLVAPATTAPVATAPTLGAIRSATGLTITFTGKLQSAPAVTGPWTDVAGAASPFAVTTADKANAFYRAAQ